MKPAFLILAFIVGFFAFTDVQPTNSFVSGSIEFKIKNMGLDVDGKMQIVHLEFKQPTDNPSTWVLEGTASPATIATGIALRDKHLKRSDYFDIEKYSVIQMQSENIRAKEKNNYEGSFKITIKGITKKVAVGFSISEKGDSKKLEGAFTINRLDFALGEESSILSDNVKVRVKGVFARR